MECESTPGCIQAAIKILGDKWSALLLKSLAENGPSRYSDLATSLPGLSTRTLTDRLRRLELEGVITKDPYSARPPRFEYSLSDKGTDLVVVLRSMASWGEKYRQKTGHKAVV